MSQDDPITKTKAVTLIMLETNRGRRAVENVIDALVAQGRIKIVPDIADKRLLLISRADMETVIRVLKGEPP